LTDLGKTRLNNYYYFHLTTIFVDEPGSATSISGPPPPPVPDYNLSGLVEQDYLMGQMSFLPPNCQWQGTERDTKHWS